MPEEYRCLARWITSVRTSDGLVPLSNFITRKPVEKLAEINRIDKKRYFDIKAGVAFTQRTVIDENGEESDVIINANERIEYLTEQINAKSLPAGISWEWTGIRTNKTKAKPF